jgi:hypothetical protein
MIQGDAVQGGVLMKWFPLRTNMAAGLELVIQQAGFVAAEVKTSPRNGGNEQI